MSYTDFSEALLIAAYLETDKRDFVGINAGDLLDSYDLEGKQGWASAAIQEFAAQGLMEDDPTLGGDRDLTIILTGKGLREAERLIDSGKKVRALTTFSDNTAFDDGTRFVSDAPANAIVTETGEPIVTESGDFIVTEAVGRSTGGAPEVAPISISSEAWTGVEFRLQSDPALVEAIRLKLKEVDTLVDQASLTNAERQKAKAISEALIKLVESPEPEWKVIVDLLNSKPLTALLNVAVVIQLVLKLIFGI